jgi:hypothetical protein
MLAPVIRHNRKTANGHDCENPEYLGQRELIRLHAGDSLQMGMPQLLNQQSQCLPPVTQFIICFRWQFCRKAVIRIYSSLEEVNGCAVPLDAC